jgi:cell division protein FtsB
MQNFQGKKGFKYFMRSRPVLVVLTIILIVFVWKVVSLTGKLQETYKNKKIEQEKILDLQKRKEKLSGDILKLNTDKGKEEIIRENFGLVKEGENVIVIIDDKEKTEAPAEPKNKGIFSFFKNIFK